MLVWLGNCDHHVTAYQASSNCAPVSALPRPAIDVDVDISTSAFRYSMRSCPGPCNTLAEANIGELGFSKPPLCGVIWRTYPMESHLGPLRPRKNPSCSSSCGGRDGRIDISNRDVAGGQHVGRPLGANHKRLRPGFAAENVGTSTSFQLPPAC